MKCWKKWANIVTRCAIWYHFKNTLGGVLFLGKLQAKAFLEVTLHQGCFSRSLNCTNGTKSQKASHIF